MNIYFVGGIYCVEFEDVLDYWFDEDDDGLGTPEHLGGTRTTFCVDTQSEGYVNNDLFLPRISKDGIAMEATDVENSRLLNFDRAVHVKALVKKDAPANGMDVNPTPFKADSGSGSDFEL